MDIEQLSRIEQDAQKLLDHASQNFKGVQRAVDAARAVWIKANKGLTEAKVWQELKKKR